MTIKRYACMFGALILAATIGCTALAKSITGAPYRGYSFNNYQESVPAPTGHIPVSRITSEEMQLETALLNPTDMFYDGKEFIYILDSGNGRIVVTDKNLHLVKIFRNFKNQNDEEFDFTGAKGLTVDKNGFIYVADTENDRVLGIENNTVKLIIERPDDALIDTEARFSAHKVLCIDDQIYVLAESINLGAFVFDTSGKFQKFFGSNPVIVSSEAILNTIRKRFMTNEQIAALKKITPINFTNFDSDDKGFIYTVTKQLLDNETKGNVRCLNYKGVDILNSKIKLTFGDFEKDEQYWSAAGKTVFIDVDVDASGFINLLDEGRGKIFQYDSNGNLVSVFGTYSSQLGGFTVPIAIESINEDVYVLDSEKASITVFRPTKYTSDIRTAFYMLSNENQEEAMTIWQNVLNQNTNHWLPYYGMGLAQDASGQYKQAMDSFQLAGDQKLYSKAFGEYREIYVRSNFWIIFSTVAMLIGIIVVVSKLVKKRLAAVYGDEYSLIQTKYMYPLYILFHPADGYDDLKTKKLTSYRLSIGIVITWFLLQALEYFKTGFHFNYNRTIDYNLSISLISSIGIFILFVISNWAVCTLFDGKGNLKEIFSVCSYALVPLLFSILLRVTLSNVLIIEESAFLSIISTVCYMWFFLLLVIGLYTIHQYSVSKTITTIVVTLFGMIVIAFLIILFYTLLQQTVNFAKSLMEEWAIR